SWADVARGPAIPAAVPPTKVIPAKQSREVLVRGGQLPADLARRTPQEIVQAAFGEQAKEARRTYGVLVKGLRKADLQGVTEADFAKEADLRAVGKVVFRFPKDPALNWVSVVVAFESQEEAKKACDSGVLFRAQLFNCEPYWAPLQPTQCYRCWKWGHIGRYCRKAPLC
ncbi:hypothetical protein N656DRAFT_693121, partial [Canariomyces notabilis]